MGFRRRRCVGAYETPTPVYYKGHLYWVSDKGIASCVDAKTGKLVKSKRITGAFYASLTLINDKFYAISRYSGAKVFEASPEFKEIASNNLGDNSDFGASPAVSDGQLFIRSDEYLYCIQEVAE